MVHRRLETLSCLFGKNWGATPRRYPMDHLWPKYSTFNPNPNGPRIHGSHLPRRRHMRCLFTYRGASRAGPQTTSGAATVESFKDLQHQQLWRKTLYMIVIIQHQSSTSFLFYASIHVLHLPRRRYGWILHLYQTIASPLVFDTPYVGCCSAHVPAFQSPVSPKCTHIHPL